MHLGCTDQVILQVLCYVQLDKTLIQGMRCLYLVKYIMSIRRLYYDSLYTLNLLSLSKGPESQNQCKIY